MISIAMDDCSISLGRGVIPAAGMRCWTAALALYPSISEMVDVLTLIGTSMMLGRGVRDCSAGRRMSSTSSNADGRDLGSYLSIREMWRKWHWGILSFTGISRSLPCELIVCVQ